MKIERLQISSLTMDPENAKLHPAFQVEQIKKSIQRFGMNDPVGIWSEQNLIVEGHGRVLALQSLGQTEIDCIRLDHLTDDERKAYAVAHNSTNMSTGFDNGILAKLLEDIESVDMTEFLGENCKALDWFDNAENKKAASDKSEGGAYGEFLEKFEEKHTTDDCYTPDIVYNAIADWVAKKYDVSRSDFVRPFYPGGNYEEFKYKAGAVVVDNPPFSILSQIREFYCSRGIKFFLFCPALTCLFKEDQPCALLAVNSSITYENGAVVNTSFQTNLEPPDVLVRTDPDLYKVVAKADEDNQRLTKKELRKFSYPDYVVTAAALGKLSRYGQDFTINRKSAIRISALDEQKAVGVAIFGGGLLISEKAAAEKAAAEKWALSERGKQIVRGLENV